MNEDLVNLIVKRLSTDLGKLSSDFASSVADVGVRHCVIDDLLPEELATHIHEIFPSGSNMRLMDNFRERKWTSKDFDRFDPLLADITFAIQDPRVIQVVEEITGIPEQMGDATLYAGGLSAMGEGHFLGPHIDNSHESTRSYYRTLNLLYYVTPGWEQDCGGNLELWDRKVKRQKTVHSRFNRLVIMETNPWSWHSVGVVKAHRVRHCVSNYYFSPRSPIDRDYFNVTSFSARPEQKVRRALAWVDGKVRRVVRWVVPGGLGKKDIYQTPKMRR